MNKETKQLIDALVKMIGHIEFAHDVKQDYIWGGDEDETRMFLKIFQDDTFFRAILFPMWKPSAFCEPIIALAGHEKTQAELKSLICFYFDATLDKLRTVEMSSLDEVLQMESLLFQGGDENHRCISTQTSSYEQLVEWLEKIFDDEDELVNKSRFIKIFIELILLSKSSLLEYKSFQNLFWKNKAEISSILS